MSLDYQTALAQVQKFCSNLSPTDAARVANVLVTQSQQPLNLQSPAGQSPWMTAGVGLAKPLVQKGINALFGKAAGGVPGVPDVTGVSIIPSGASSAAPFGVMTDSSGSAIGTLAGGSGGEVSGALDAVANTPSIGNAGYQVLGQGITSGLQGLGVGAETAGSIGSAAGVGIPVIGGGLSAYSLVKQLMSGKKDPMGGAMSGAGLGASIGSIFPGAGTIVGGLIGALAGGGLGMIGHGKNYFNKVDREGLKDAWAKSGFLNSDKTFALPGGSTFDLSQHEKGGQDKGLYNVDTTKQGAAIGMVNPLAVLMSSNKNDTLAQQAAGYLTNAVSSAGDARTNARSLYTKAGYNMDSAWKAIDALATSGALDKGTADAYKNGITDLFTKNK